MTQQKLLSNKIDKLEDRIEDLLELKMELTKSLAEKIKENAELTEQINQLKQIEIQIKLGIKQKAINSNYGTLLIESIRNIKTKEDE